MSSRNSTRMFLLFLAAAFLPYGVYCFAAPTFLAEVAGVAGTTPTGVTELRAMYGGLQAGFGLLMLVAGLDRRLTLAGTAAAAFVMPGLAFARLLGSAIDAGITSYTAGALALEISCSMAAVSLLRRELSVASTKQ